MESNRDKESINDTLAVFGKVSLCCIICFIAWIIQIKVLKRNKKRGDTIMENLNNDTQIHTLTNNLTLTCIQIFNTYIIQLQSNTIYRYIRNIF